MKINKKMIKFLLLFVMLCIFSCGPPSVTYKYKFSGRSDPFSHNNIIKSKDYTYSFDFGNNDDSLIEKNILFHIGKYLNSIGWEYRYYFKLFDSVPEEVKITLLLTALKRFKINCLDT